MEIFCRIKPKYKSDIWAQSNKKAMLDVRLLICFRATKIQQSLGAWALQTCGFEKDMRIITKKISNFSQICKINSFLCGFIFLDFFWILYEFYWPHAVWFHNTLGFFKEQTLCNLLCRDTKWVLLLSDGPKYFEFSKCNEYIIVGKHYQGVFTDSCLGVPKRYWKAIILPQNRIQPKKNPNGRNLIVVGLTSWLAKLQRAFWPPA